MLLFPRLELGLNFTNVVLGEYLGISLEQLALVVDLLLLEHKGDDSLVDCLNGVPLEVVREVHLLSLRVLQLVLD